MTPFEALTQEEQEKITDYIAEYGDEYHSPKNSVPLSRTLGLWDSAKSDLFSLCGGLAHCSRRPAFLMPLRCPSAKIKNLFSDLRPPICIMTLASPRRISIGQLSMRTTSILGRLTLIIAEP